MTQRILTIEDDRESRELLAEALAGQGYQVLQAADGRSGLTSIVAHRPDLVLCDILLPDLSGFEIMEQLAARPEEGLAATPFIFLSALDDRLSILRGRRLGADDYVTKPIDFEILSEIVKRRLAPADRSAPGRLPELTAREREVLTWVARGKSSADIGLLLTLSEDTVDYHIQKVMRKLGVATRIQAAITAANAKLIRV